MAGGTLGRDNLRRAPDGFSRALVIDGTAYPEFVRDVIDNGRIPGHCRTMQAVVARLP